MTATITIDIEGMHCASCVLLVDEALEDLPGVITATTNLRKSRSTVEIDPARTSATKLVKAIRRIGYNATVTR